MNTEEINKTYNELLISLATQDKSFDTELFEAIGRGWSAEENIYKPVDVHLALAIKAEIHKLLTKHGVKL